MKIGAGTASLFFFLGGGQIQLHLPLRREKAVHRLEWASTVKEAGAVRDP